MKRLSLFLFLFTSIIFITVSCQKELSLETDQNLAKGTLFDSLGACNAIIPSGTYYNGVSAVRDTNFVKVIVNVTKTGDYTLQTDSINGFGFRAAGYFPKLGTDTVLMQAFGSPTLNVPTDFRITFDSSACGFTILVQDSTGTGLGGSTGVFPVDDSSFVDPNPAQQNTWHFTDSTTGVTYSGIFTPFEGAGFQGDTLFVAGQAVSTIDTLLGATIKIPSLLIAPGIYPINETNNIVLTNNALNGDDIYVADADAAFEGSGNSYITITGFSNNQLSASFHTWAYFNGDYTLIAGSFNCLVH